MVTNKSIDGLSTRDAKNKALNSSLAPKKVKKSPAKPITPKLSEDFINGPTTNMWDSIEIASKKANDSLEIEDFIEEVPAPKSLSPVKPSKPKKKEAVTDFLKPIQAFDFDEDEGLTESEETVKDIRESFGGATDNEEEEEETVSQKSDKDMKKEEKALDKKFKKAKKKPSKKRRIISIIALIIVLIMIGGVIWMILWGNDIIAKITGGRGNILDLFSLNSETYDPLKTDSNGRTNILAFGTGGYDMNGEEGGGVHDGAQLTDSIMLISLDQKTGDTAMISLPRDLKGPSTCTSTGKINEIYWCNGGSGDATTEEEEKAANALMTAVGSILGVDIQYYAHLNWGSVVSIVDTLGGITVTLDEDILDYYYTGAVYYANTPYTLNGAEAVGLARARHGTTGGDFSRGASQQKIIIGIKNRVFEKELSLPDILGLITTLGDNLRTNFSLSEMKTLAHDSQILDFDVMRQISLYPDYMTTGMLNGISYVLPKAGVGNYQNIKAFVATQLSSDPRDYEDPTIAIYNATDTDGLATEEKLKLEKEGYVVTIVDNAPEGEYRPGTSIYTTTTKPGTFHLLENRYNFTPLSIEELPATISPDYDFIIILNNK